MGAAAGGRLRRRRPVALDGAQKALKKYNASRKLKKVAGAIIAQKRMERALAGLKVAASCGEPLSPAMHKLGMAVLTPNYINSYWATEHGGMVWSRLSNDPTPIRPDTHTNCIPVHVRAACDAS